MKAEVGRTNIPRAEVRQYGLGRILMYARQKAINRVMGGALPHLYLDSMPLVTQSAFEYLRMGKKGAAEAAKAAFDAFGRVEYELTEHFIYQRLIGPNDTALGLTLGETLSILSDREIKAIALNTGMSAFTAVFDLLRPGDTLIYHPVLYGCTKNKIVTHLPKMGIKVQPNKLENLATLKAQLTTDPSVRMIVTETELNPTLYVPPVDNIAQLVDEANGERLAKGWRPVFFIVDNTFPTFGNMNVLGLGVHCVIESMTKFICGMGENMGGFVAFDQNHDFHLADEDYGDLYKFIMMMHKDDGLSMSPFPAWDILRYLPSMEMRRDWVQPQAQALAEFLKEHPKVATVNYPGMTGDPAQDARARVLMRDERGRFAPGYMVYFTLKGDPGKVKLMGRTLLNWASENTSLKVKVSFGQEDTNLEHPADATHSSYTREELDLAGIDDGGIRVAQGWDTAQYIRDCLDEGLRQI